MNPDDWSLRELYRTLATPDRRSPANATRKGSSGCGR
jgi:hypothetical protein